MEVFKPKFTGEPYPEDDRLDPVKNILRLRKFGRKVVQLTPYQFRIDDAIDLYPKNHRFHNLKTGKRGFYPAY